MLFLREVRPFSKSGRAVVLDKASISEHVIVKACKIKLGHGPTLHPPVEAVEELRGGETVW